MDSLGNEKAEIWYRADLSYVEIRPQLVLAETRDTVTISNPEICFVKEVQKRGGLCGEHYFRTWGAAREYLYESILRSYEYDKLQLQKSEQRLKKIESMEVKESARP